MSTLPVPLSCTRDDSTAVIAGTLFGEAAQVVFRRTDRMFAGLMAFQWVAAIVAALVISPRAWSGIESRTHIHVWAAFLLGGVIVSAPIVLALCRPRRTLTRHVVAVGQMLMSALLIHLLGGRIETHFHVFGSLAFLAFYRDWRVLVSATVVVALDHLLRGIFWPQSVYGVAGGAEWRWLEHAGWVAFEDAFLILSCAQSVQEMRAIALRQAEIGIKNIELAETTRRAEAAAEAKGQFLANMSHEIRTPLNSILGFADLLRREAADNEAERREWLDTIYSSGNHLLELINNILDLSRIDSGLMQVERIPCRPAHIIAEVSSILRPRAGEKGLSLETVYEGAIPASIQSDPTRFRQLLINVIGNAIKFTENGGVRVVTSLKTSGSPRLCIKVIDSGIGISADKLASIFDPFVQADSSTTRKYGGSGLGLAISSRLAQTLGGSLAVTSEPGKGSVFTCEVDTGSLASVPLITDPVAEAVISNHVAPVSEIRLASRPRILLVDDGETNRKLIRIVLRRAGADVTEAKNGDVAVELAGQADFKLILMDMQMPVCDGYTATRLIRELGVTCPIIALTANAMRGDEGKCRAAGCTGYLAKPVMQDTLLRAVALALGIEPAPAPETPAPAGPPPSPGDADAPLISELPADDAEFREVVVEFVQRLGSQLERMHQAMLACDMAELEQLAHWLKGAGGTAGFPAFTEPAAALLLLARQHRLEAIRPGIDELRRLADRIATDPPGDPADPNLVGERIQKKQQTP